MTWKVLALLPVSPHPDVADLPILPLYRRPGDAMGDFLQAWIAAMALESVVESSAENVLGMFRQVGPHSSRQIGI